MIFSHMVKKYNWKNEACNDEQGLEQTESEVLEIRKFAVEQAVEFIKTPGLNTIPLLSMARAVEDYLLHGLTSLELPKVTPEDDEDEGVLIEE